MPQGLRAEEMTLQRLLRPGTELAMPPYQRSYSWDKGEASDLLGDLVDASQTGEVHFVGAIVLVEDTDGRFLIVDGQQRLTTLTMILCILRDLEDDDERAKKLSELICSIEETTPDGMMSWRLSLNHIDGPFFRESVQAPGATVRDGVDPNESESQKRMATNAGFLLGELKAMSPEARTKLMLVMIDRLLLVRVVVEDWDGGYRVFRVLNTRGKAPNSHDIIKTDLLERARMSSLEANRYSRQWSEHEARLGGTGFDDLLNQIRFLYNRNAPHGSAGFRKAVLPKVDARLFLAEELPSFVEAYVTISTGNGQFGELSDRIRIPLNHLRLIDHQLWRAPALRFLVRGDTTPETALAFFEKLERFAFAMMLVVTERKQRLKRYGRVSDAVDDPALLLSDRGPLALSRDERKRMSTRLLGRFGSFSQRRAIALRLNAAIDGGDPLSPSDGATVEHVLPRNFPEESMWSQSWPSQTIHRELSETIGNFVLLSQHANQQADNASFDDKKALYFANGSPEYALTQDLADHVAWTPDIVRNRTVKLAEILLDAWSLND
ncbi:MAG: DUF262 domain-containing HNH endonuclease family protein [Pseudomonadota bacterium]